MAWKYIYFRKKISRQNPKFFSCPIVCAYEKTKNSYCDSCDKKKLFDNFQEKTVEAWRKEIGKDSEKFRFDDVFTILKTVIELENLPPEKMSVKTSRILDVYLAEKAKEAYIEYWDNIKKD